MAYGTRIGEQEFVRAPYWADGIADYLIERFPERKTFVCAAGISPSGPVHFGNFREIATTFAVSEALIHRGKEAKVLFSWDNFDRFRKVPSSIPSSYKEHVGKPLSSVPARTSSFSSYAHEYQEAFTSSMHALRLPVSYRDQTALYTSGAYDSHIITAMQKREAIADILLSFMTEKGKEAKGIIPSEFRSTFYPISLYSRFSGKDAVAILSYDGASRVRYRCRITGKEEEIDFTETRIVKLNWKVDWAMRWMYEQVCFEPAGSDHAAPGGSYDVSAAIAKEVFAFDAPVFTEFGFVGLQGLGSKMSGSKGQTITPDTLLSIYEPSLLLWMYLRRLPRQTFSLAFDTEVYRQYDELDVAVVKHFPSFLLRFFRRTPSDPEARIVRILFSLYPDYLSRFPISFRQVVGFAQAVWWDEKKLASLLRVCKVQFSSTSLRLRLKRAYEWVVHYSKDGELMLCDTPNKAVWDEMDATHRSYIHSLRTYITRHGTASLSNTEAFLYALPKTTYPEGDPALKKAQRRLFSFLYRLLLNHDTGPRLSTLFWSIPNHTLLELLTFPDTTDTKK